jgi:hypothetical protein
MTLSEKILETTQKGEINGKSNTIFEDVEMNEIGLQVSQH